jgi:hypothetical protein
VLLALFIQTIRTHNIAVDGVIMFVDLASTVIAFRQVLFIICLLTVKTVKIVKGISTSEITHLRFPFLRGIGSAFPVLLYLTYTNFLPIHAKALFTTSATAQTMINKVSKSIMLYLPSV